MPKVKHLDGIDEVSAMLGSLKESTKNLEKGQNEIKRMVEIVEKHLRIMNGTISKHQQKMGACDERFSNLDEELKETKDSIKEQIISEKSWTRAKVGIYVSVGLALLAILVQFALHGR